MRYIGARYVPIFYTNSDDGSTLWQMNVNYEPLTYVTDANNHMYLSKKMVPDHVGHPADNIDYWLDVTTFIGSTQDLQDQIDAIVLRLDSDEGDITDIQNDIDDIISHKNILMMFGDSFLEGGGWGTPLATYMGSAQSYNYGVGGSGFARTGFTSFKDELDNARSALTEEQRKAVTHVILGGGINDYATADSTLRDAATLFFATGKTDYPNAKLYYFANHGRYVFTKNIYEKYRIIKDCAIANGWAVLEDIEFTLMGAGDYFVQNDDVHPTAPGYALIAQSIFNAINGNYYSYLVDYNYNPSAVVNAHCARRGSMITFNCFLNITTAGQVPDGTTIGVPPIGKRNAVKTYYKLPITDQNGIQRGVAVFTTDGVKAYNLGTHTGEGYVNASFNLIGMVD